MSEKSGKKVLVTGASGFVGGHFLSACDHDCVPVTRGIYGTGGVAIGDMAAFDDWQSLFQGVDVIVHLAARVHQVADDDPAAYHRDNVLVVERMLAAAMSCGVKRFIFVSSIKVRVRLFLLRISPLPLILMANLKRRRRICCLIWPLACRWRW